MNEGSRAATYLGPEQAKLGIVRMSGEESLGSLFEYRVELASPENDDIDHSAMLGKPAAVRFVGRESYERYFHGIVTEFQVVGIEGRLCRYRMTLRPWLWLLSQTWDCRIFQEKSITQILADVFKEHGFSDYKQSLRSSYESHDFIVQYNESTLDFLLRWMQREGIYFYFEHSESKHELILADAPSSHRPDDAYRKLRYLPPQIGQSHRFDHVDQWSIGGSLTSGTSAMSSFNFESPKQELNVESKQPGDHEQHKDLEVFRTHNYPQRDRGTHYAKVHQERMSAERVRCTGSGDASALLTGNTFELEGHPIGRLNQEYLIVGTSIAMDVGDYQGGADEDFEFHCSFTCMPADVQYRAAFTVPWPMSHGPQTAIVVGARNDEIYTDKYGRIKVQFHWDRYGKSDHSSSCWIRVSQVHAGRKFGGIDLPRIGEEVIVDFLEGDPDQPIVIGRVYNGASMPPYDLPGKKSESGMRSKTVKGNGYNELVFDDTDGKELVRFHAEHDVESTVQNDVRSLVKQKVDATVEGEATYEVKKDETHKVGKTLTITVADQITIKTGMAKITMKKSGEIVIKGSKITIDGTQEVKAKAGITLTAQSGVKAELKGTMVDVKGSAMTQVNGGLVKIN